MKRFIDWLFFGHLTHDKMQARLDLLEPEVIRLHKEIEALKRIDRLQTRVEKAKSDQPKTWSKVRAMIEQGDNNAV